MNRLLLCLALASCAQVHLRAQTLFTYGKKSVEKREFLWAYHKNNASASGGKTSEQQYLSLYINYKLKVQAARDAHLDTGAEFRRDSLAYSRELADQVMKREEGISRLSREALLRGQEDIELAQVYVGIPSPGDTAAAYSRIREALGQIKAGVDFGTVATAYGTNPYLKDTKGYTGYITVFSLPYDAENIVYALRDGAYSGIYRSRSGYHIFKRLGHRPNPGTLRAAQILFAFAPSASPEEKQQVLLKARAVYDSLLRGASFDSLVRKFSDDRITYYNYGALPDFTTGDFDPFFERAAFALPSNGSVSPPIQTSYGYHIIKRIGLQPPLKDSLDNQRWYTLQEKVFYSDRMDASRSAFAASLLPRLQYRPLLRDSAWLYRTTDMLLQTRGGEEYIRKVKPAPLFALDGKVYTSTDWFHYLLYKRPGDPRALVNSYPPQLAAFVRVSALDYYQANLSKLNEDYRYEVQEYTEGTLLFAIMQQQVWDKAEVDTASLRKWFEAHRSRFYQKPSADVVAFTAPDSSMLRALRVQLQDGLQGWRSVLGKFPGMEGEAMHVDLGAISLDSARAREGMITRPVQLADKRWRSYGLLKTYHSAPAGSYMDVQGQVQGDYQAYLEQQWLNVLRKKYPVVVKQSL